MERVLRHLRENYGVSDRALCLLHDLVEPTNFERKTPLISEGSRDGRAYFIASGMTRSYWTAEGEEFTTSFSTAGAIVFSMDELYFGRPSEETVEAVEAVEAFAIRIEDLQRLWADEPELMRWALRIHQLEYRRIHQAHRERLTLSAEKRYRTFVESFPEVAKRARLSDIASYLGITGSTLSRLRRK